jgi:transcriptional regulator of acetoin/glycerol metabolism
MYDWPGNIRELRNVLERAVIVKPEGPVLGDDVILGTSSTASSDDEPVETLSLGEMEKQMIVKVLRLTSGNKSEAARLLGITRRALYGRIERYGLDD